MRKGAYVSIAGCIYIDDRITANLYLVVVFRLQVELLDGGSICRSIIFGEIAYVGSQLYVKHFLSQCCLDIEVMV